MKTCCYQWWGFLALVIFAWPCITVRADDTVAASSSIERNGIAVLEINSETFNATHATLVTQTLLKTLEKIPSISFSLFACVHSSQDLIYDMALQNFLYAHTLPIKRFYFSASEYGSVCATELPSSLLVSAITLIQVSGSVSPAAVTALHVTPSSNTDTDTNMNIITTPDISLLQLPTSLVLGLRAHLQEAQQVAARGDQDSGMPSRLEVATLVTGWLLEQEQEQKQDLARTAVHQTCQPGQEKFRGECHIIQPTRDGGQDKDKLEQEQDTDELIVDADGTRERREVLPRPAASDVFHASGPCRLWWPLNHSEIFLLASASASQQRWEDIIFTCPDLQTPQTDNNAHADADDEEKVEDYIVVLEGFQATGTAKPSLLQHPRVMKTREVVSLQGVDMAEALQLGALYSLPPVGNAQGVASKWIRISLCKASIRALSECVSRFTLSRTVVYGDTWQPSVRHVDVSRQHHQRMHPMSTQIHTRDVFGHALNMFGLTKGTFVEVGVNKGHFAKLMLEQWQGARYVMVDPWQSVSSSSYVDIANSPNQQVHEAVLLEALTSVAPHGARPAVS